MWKQLLYKWFGLSDTPCETCEVLRLQLEKSESERRELLHRLLDKDKIEPLVEKSDELKPVGQQFIPWRVRQQMLEQADRTRAALMKEKQAEMSPSIEKLEDELGVKP